MNSKKPQFLTKSRFKLGYECPTKLVYLDDPSFGNNNTDNSFLEALAEGGFQVGELAKLYHSGGTEIRTLNKDEAVEQTRLLLNQEKAIIYEAAFKFENLFIRADIILKTGNKIELIEVKAKSFDPKDNDQFYNKTSLKKGIQKLSSTWEPYLVDVAFQTYVLKKCHPKANVTSFLMLADKSAKATIDGLNQKFFLQKSEAGKTSVKVISGTNHKNIGAPLLKKICVDSEVKTVWEMNFENGLNFEKMVQELSSICGGTKTAKSKIGVHCKNCEFRISEDAKRSGLKSGFESCWKKQAMLKDSDFKRPFVFDIWNFRKAAKLIENEKYFADQLEVDDVDPTSKIGENGLSSSERQWLQVEKIIKKNKSPYLDADGLSAELKSWTYPLHFIDFETTMVAIPFHMGRHPYEQIAFQYSHHLVNKDGTIQHKDEYINEIKGAFPNFEFVRSLKKALSSDQGTIFRYATHENTVLCQIRDQLLSSSESIPDRTELIQFIESITTPTGDSAEKWKSNRNMVDMCELVKKYYFHPATKGSNSIKKVLPAILNASTYLKEKYSAEIYGSNSNLLSKNYSKWKWVKIDTNGIVIDPYKLLPPIFSDLDLETMDSLITEGSIADGGAAMTAYSRMQFTEMSPQESKRVAEALLKYCELDTFAMVLIYEYWKNEIKQSKKSGKAA